MPPTVKSLDRNQNQKNTTNSSNNNKGIPELPMMSKLETIRPRNLWRQSRKKRNSSRGVVIVDPMPGPGCASLRLLPLPV